VARRNGSVVEEIVFYREDGSYIKFDHIFEVGLEYPPSEFKFYDSMDKLRRRVTNPLEIGMIKHDILYGEHGEVISDTVHGSAENYDFGTDKWKLLLHW